MFFCFFFLYPLYTFSLSNELGTNSFQQIMKYNNILNQKPLGTLYKDIESHQIDGIFFSNDLKTIYSHDSFSTPSTPPFPLYYSYEITNSNPILANSIIDFSNKNQIESTILVDPENSLYNSWTNGIHFMGQIVDTLFYPTLFFLIIYSVINSFTNPGINSGVGINPFFSNGNNGNNFQKDKQNMQKLNITLDSWAGSPEILEECIEVVSYLKNNTLYKNAGAEIPKGILLEGPPGTGKTLLAKAIASEANASFVAITASEFVELYVGMGAAKVRNLFAQARQNTPAILFIDELDAVGRQRGGSGPNMGNEEREQTLNQLLSEMDGFALNQDILVIAATNRKDILDSALLRPGRFDRIITIGLPDVISRKNILNVYLKNKIVDYDLNVDILAEMTAGFSGAQLKNFINEAAIYAVRAGNSIITQENIELAIEKSVVGIIKKKESRSEEVLQRVAIHEMGHGFLAFFFQDYFQLQKITIQSTYNGAGGYTLFQEYPEIKDGGLYTRDLLMKRLMIALGGKAAESIFYEDKFLSVGAIQDIKQANKLAQQMIGNYGMGNELKVFYNENIDSSSKTGIFYGQDEKYSEKTKETFDYEVNELILEAYLDAKEIILNNKQLFIELVDNLKKNITLTNNNIQEYFLENNISLNSFPSF